METQETTATMEQIVLHITCIKFFKDEDKTNVQVRFKEEIDGFKEENGVIVPAKVSQFSMSLRKLTAQLCSANDDFAFARSIAAKAFNEGILAGLLFKAQVVIERELHKKGELNENNEPLDRDKFYTKIVKFEMSGKSKDLCDQLIEKGIEKVIYEEPY